MQAEPHIITVRVKGPFDLHLSLAGRFSFLPVAQAPSVLTTVVGQKTPSIISVAQKPHWPSSVSVSATPPIDHELLKQMTKWLVSSELDLSPFYRIAARQPRLAKVIYSLKGLKPLRPPTLFEMLIIAITEQQLSLAAAFHIRTRLIARFGKRVGNLWRFPTAERLASASLQQLMKCGLSGRKANYVKHLAARVAQGSLDLESLKKESDQRIYEQLLAIRGFGKWSVQYMLARGFGRADVLPSDDVGLQRAISHFVANDRILDATQLERALAPFKPFRALAAYYLAVHWRLHRLRSAANAPNGGCHGTPI
jgi:DNA-3-methyladenine glycosylase II